MSAYAATRSPAAYKQQSILTAPRGPLVVMLYDGCVRFLSQAAHAMRAGDAAEACVRADRRRLALPSFAWTPGPHS